MEIKKLIKTYKIYMSCPICKEGMMMHKDAIDLFIDLAVRDDQYHGVFHKCNKCGHTEYYNCFYPHEEQEEIDG